MALVRVYCGVATAEIAPWLTVAVVDDAGRLLDMRHISDDPAGYAYSARCSRTAPAAPPRSRSTATSTSSPSCWPRPTGRWRSPTRRPSHDFAERFADDASYDEMQAPVSTSGAPSGWPGRCRPAPSTPPPRPVLEHGRVQAGARRPRRRDRRPAGRRGRAARGAARAVPGRAAGLPRPGRVRAAADPRRAARAGPAHAVAVQPATGRPRSSPSWPRAASPTTPPPSTRSPRCGWRSRSRPLEQQPHARPGRGRDGPAGRRRRPRLRRRLRRARSAAWSSASARRPNVGGLASACREHVRPAARAGRRVEPSTRPYLVPNIPARPRRRRAAGRRGAARADSCHGSARPARPPAAWAGTPEGVRQSPMHAAPAP